MTTVYKIRETSHQFEPRYSVFEFVQEESMGGSSEVARFFNFDAACEYVEYLRNKFEKKDLGKTEGHVRYTSGQDEVPEPTKPLDGFPPEIIDAVKSVVASGLRDLLKKL